MGIEQIRPYLINKAIFKQRCREYSISDFSGDCYYTHVKTKLGFDEPN